MRNIVNVAVIRDNRVLLVKEKDRNLWTFPGGGREEYEDDISCLNRELREELDGIEGAAFIFFGFKYGVSPASGDKILVRLYRVEVEGYIRPGKDVRAIAWVTADTNYQVTDTTKALLVALKNRGYLV